MVGHAGPARLNLVKALLAGRPVQLSLIAACLIGVAVGIVIWRR